MSNPQKEDWPTAEKIEAIVIAGDPIKLGDLLPKARFTLSRTGKRYTYIRNTGAYSQVRNGAGKTVEFRNNCYVQDISI